MALQLICKLSSKAIEDLYTFCGNDPRERLAYWYFQFSDLATQSVCNMMRSIIRQLSSSPLPRAIYQLCERHRKAGSAPGVEELANALDEIISGLEGEVFIVIDALDECPQSIDQPERKELLSRIGHLLDKHIEHLHILATSRPEPDILSALKSYPAINVELFVEGDVKQFVKSAFQSEELNGWSDAIKHQIEDRLVSAKEM